VQAERYAAGQPEEGRRGGVSGDLIDTTEMYLRTVYELEEEGIVPLRARIAERLHQSGPTVSQTVARMERDGLLTVADDRHLELTEPGRAYATRVMRKHRLAERLLVDVIGMDWALVHDEACRWEHVISDDVERRLVAVLDGPTESPYGNPIPGLAELGVAAGETRAGTSVVALPTLLAEPGEVVEVTVVRIAEPLQAEHDVMGSLQQSGAVPGAHLAAESVAGGVVLRVGDRFARLTGDQAGHIYVST
jgi:DtxR family Mn-dependent transcriptional regulator